MIYKAPLDPSLRLPELGHRASDYPYSIGKETSIGRIVNVGFCHHGVGAELPTPDNLRLLQLQY